jgi:hypothetical protein
MGRLDVAKTSFAQLRLITVVTAMLALAFSGLLLAETWLSTDWLESGWGSIAVPALTLTVLRNTTLVNGVAPSTPALLCMLCVYGWAVGRMARLSLAHATSRIAPKDGETDLVSTPIQLVLHPGYEGCTESDEGFTEVERDVHNSIWRPITGRYYVAASCALGLFPLVLFTMKPLSTLEGFCGTYLLAGGLGLAVFLIGVTLIQLAQYWTTLERLLKRTMQHPIGSAFATVPHFARDSVDHQISRSPNELLRWSACAQLYSDLVVTSERIEDCVGVASCRAWLRQSQRDLHRLRRGALGSKTKQRGVTLELALVQKVILTASSVTAILERAWDRSERQQLATLATAAIQTDAAVPAAHRAAVGAEWNLVSVTLAVPANPQSKNPANEALTTTTVTRSSAPPSGPRHAQPEAPNATAPRETDDAHDDALSPVAHRFTAAQLRWLRSAQTFVATVVTLLIHRHIRQFRYFLSVTTGCSLLLLLAVASYPFEPYRLILTFIWVIVASVVAMGFWVFIRMDRNTLMSHISGTSPNEVTWNAAFVLRVVAWAIVPLLGIAATQYPQLANVLFSVLGPVTRALR